MTSEKLFEKLCKRVGAAPELREQTARARMEALNERLSHQLASHAMSEEVLVKSCTLRWGG